MNIAQRLRALAKRTALDGIAEELVAIAQELDRAGPPMTEELKQAAQAALEQLEFLNACYPHKTATDTVDALRRALTQRPAAQTEREAFEAWARPHGYDLRRNDVLGHYSSIDTSRAWAGFRAGRASQPAPQQATPERHLTVTTNQQGEAVMVSWQDDEHRILEVVWERKQATPEPGRCVHGHYCGHRGPVPDAPTPEPVGEAVARFDENKGRPVLLDDAPMLAHGDLLYTRPATGVPEDVQRDAERWGFAMDWSNSDFAVCRRVGKTGACWEPIKTSGPVDAAMLAVAQAQAK